jgi:hypothetical protein
MSASLQGQLGVQSEQCQCSRCPYLSVLKSGFLGPALLLPPPPDEVSFPFPLLLLPLADVIVAGACTLLSFSLVARPIVA